MTTFHPGPYHILSYGALLGSTVFNSFVGNVVAYRALPRAQFAQLQTALFPPYFAIQTVLPLLLGLTYPAPSGPSAVSSGVSALLRSRTDLLYIVATAVSGALNWWALGPLTTKVMKHRKHQETRDGKKSYDQGPHSEQMRRLNRNFMWLHGASSVANLVALVALVAYGWRLGARLS